MQTAKFKAGGTILSEGEDGNTAFLITVGSVEVSVGKGRSAKRLGTLAAGEVFGEMSLLEPGPRSATVKAVTDTECVLTSYDDFLASMHENPERAVEFMKTLVGRLRQMTELVVSMEPSRRRLRDVFQDWIELSEDELRDDEMLARSEAMLHWGTMF